MHELPAQMDERDLPIGRFITSRHNWTVSDVGGAFPIEPPIKAPAGSHIVAGGELVGEHPFVCYNRLAMYVDGHRVNLYQFTGGEFIPVGDDTPSCDL